MIIASGAALFGYDASFIVRNVGFSDRLGYLTLFSLKFRGRQSPKSRF
jgi:hypothetical protein